jgi:hypothetical protein
MEVEVEVADRGAEMGDVGVGRGYVLGSLYVWMCGMHVVAALKILFKRCRGKLAECMQLEVRKLDSKLLGSFGDLGE